MKLLNKTEQWARLENKPAIVAIHELLTGYRSTPHPATGIAPYDARYKQSWITQRGRRQVNENEVK